MRTIPFIDTESLVIPRIIPFAGLMMLFLITTFALSLQLNRQSTISQEISLNQTAHAIVYHGGQLIHEQWQLLDLVTDYPTDQRTIRSSAMSRTIADHRGQIEHHLQMLTLSPGPAASSAVAPIIAMIDQYHIHWGTVQPLLDQLEGNPHDETVRQALADRIVMMNQQLDQLVQAGQKLFTTRLENWLESLQYLNSLLTSATMILLVTVLLVSYLFYLFFSMQSRVESALRDSANRLHAILDTIPDAVLRLKRTGHIVDHKPARYYQPFTKRNCVGETLAGIVPESIAQLLQQTANQVFTTGEQETIEYGLAVATDQLPLAADAHLNSSSSTLPERIFEARFLPTANDEIQLLVRDITSEKAADAASLQAQKLESIGILAGGIAHDFNNILTGLLAQTTLARRKIEKGLPVQSNLDKAILSTNRAADLTRQLLAYAGQGKFQIRPLNLNQLIHDTATLLETALASSAQLQLHLTDPLPYIEADHGQIQQIVMNLVINAAEALHDDQGRVQVRTALQMVAESSECTNYMAESLKPGQYVVLEVTDNGAGMDQAMLTRIFDPFFSTKATGHGLGLSAVLGIIRTHHGGIRVESRPGQGTTFTILLPALPDTIVACSEPKTNEELAIDLSQTILVIDDEAPVRDAVSDILMDRGFVVMTAAGGEEGIATLRHQGAKIGMVLLDLKMPGMNGSETYHQLRQIEPGIKVIFTSGYSESELPLDVGNTEGIAFLPKPYSAASLTDHVQKMML